MTVNEANAIVMGLVGEDDFHNVKNVITSYYDIAQKQIATTVCPILKTFTAECGERVPLPHDFYRFMRVGASYTRDGDIITVEGNGTHDILYYAYPTKLLGGDAEFDIDPEAQSALPYFAAAQTVLTDSDMRRYYAFMDTYNNILTNIAASGKNAMLYVVALGGNV